MNIDLLEKCVSKENWGKYDLRILKGELLKCAQEKQKCFMPLDKNIYSGNPIQLIDFFAVLEEPRLDLHQ